ncbi:MAG: NAD(P)/FAD-dependent oxidoreductase [Planctomycetota bacterium]
MTDADCIIVGGGLAGLVCGRTLVRAGRRVLVLEAADHVGGRVATDTVDGFRIDRGFQVYNDAYPEGLRQLDLAALRLGRFDAGALIAEGSRLRRVADPWRQPLAAVAAVLTGTIGMADGLRTAWLRHEAIASLRSGRLDPDATGAESERTTADELAARGFSRAFVQRFFVPFFGGVFLERSLETAAPVFLFDFAMFALGRACLPAGGMAAIPAQLAAGLPAGSLTTATRVRAVAPGSVELADGRRLSARDVVVATDRAAAATILPPDHRGAWADRGDTSTRLVAFAADRSPLDRPTLLVSADHRGPIDNLTVPSDVAAGYAPPGAALVTVSVRHGFSGDGESLAAAVREQAVGWFGGETRHWRPLATVTVPHALPDESPAARRLRSVSPRLAAGLFLCGDHCGSASINGALASGRRAAEAVLSG